MTPARFPWCLPPALLALSPGTLGDSQNAGAFGAEDRFLAALERALAAGLRGLLIREPELADGRALTLARRARALLVRGDGWLGLHDRVHLAEPAGAHAVHLGFRSIAPDVARRLLPEGIAIGLSTHAGDDPAALAEVDYRFFGPVFETPSKRGLKPATGLTALAASASSTLPPSSSATPVWAIGGIGPERAAETLAHGAQGVAVLNGIFGAHDPAAAVSAYLAAAPALIEGKEGE